MQETVKTDLCIFIYGRDLTIHNAIIFPMRCRIFLWQSLFFRDDLRGSRRGNETVLYQSVANDLIL